MSNPTQEELPLNLPVPSKERGYLYIMRCASHRKDQRKIGLARKDPKYHRAKELGGTSNPDPFTVEYDALVFDAPKIEKILHAKLAPFRHASNREFFNVPLQTAIDAIKEVAGTNFIIDKFGETNKFAVLPPVFPKLKVRQFSSPPVFPKPRSPQPVLLPVFPKLKASHRTPPPTFPKLPCK